MRGKCWAHQSAHLTSGTESGLWRSPQACNATQGPKSLEFMKHCLKTNQSQITLTDQVRHWPTPTCQEVEHREVELSETGRRKSKDGSTSHSLNLADKVKMWPTPCATDHKGAGKTGELRDRLDYAVERGGTKSNHSFPTPCAQDYRRRGPNSNQQGLPEQIHKMQHWATPRKFMHKDSTTDRGKCNLGEQVQGQLNPDWVEWLMGWPIGWTRLESIKLDWRDWSVDPADTGEVSRVGKGIKNRVNRLKAIGNGQVPAVVRLAWNFLQGEHEKGRVRTTDKELAKLVDEK